jgi:diguanylate cyclase (GGDEF)-like protein/putative nucleotidyltransferase with HDIG domain
MLDVDHFKSINDNYGHPAGDTVLKAVAKLIQSEIRDVDFPVRYGGEEFLLVLPEVNQEGAIVVAERIRKNLSQETIQHEGISINVTASFGIASFPDDANSQQSLLDLADRSLYLSKRLGRNQVHSASDLLFEEPKKSLELSWAPIPPPQLSEFVPQKLSEAAEQKEELVPEVIEMVKALATALYSKSDYNKMHHLETARLSELLGKVMGLNQQQIEQIRVAGLLHDVGTLSIPSDLINKPGKLSEDERKVVNQHPVLGAQLLRPIRALRDICEILENHHERWDGTGFPHGLKGEEIPLPARIVAIVDSYHALISDRPYRKALPPEEAIKILREGASRQWDPFLVDIFIAVLNSLSNNQAPTEKN